MKGRTAHSLLCSSHRCKVPAPLNITGVGMGKNRLEAFSDGVIAIIITIMVLELKVPQGEHFRALAPLIPVFLSLSITHILNGRAAAPIWGGRHR